ncbi:hypothetical protein ABI_04830 [Asticcacaulis biprosthecium C19]|uniref:Lipoprotein n=1 Tax=Asticcacaulis biprosthecium C19 TaxID=715226 RepID=F4QK24_9CAUL|nr:hypothetical protein [Asticcacaulis biprosthecium]EGF92051.1 hypothetical protein ABI_04830 [Asticcacaulis biprosthecium C19]
MNKNHLLTAAALAGLTLLSACATATPYAPADLTSSRSYRPGFTESKLEEGRFRLTFAGNDLTPRDTVETYLLYRAAELTLQEGYDWFEVVNRDTDSRSRTVYTDPFPGAYSGLSWRYYGRSRWTGWGMGYNSWDAQEYTRYEARAEIVLHKGPKPDGDPNAYDARSIQSNLESRIVRPVDGQR